jgi:hypothetical protein
MGMPDTAVTLGISLNRLYPAPLQRVGAICSFLVLLLPVGAYAAESAFDHAHAAWNSLLREYVAWTDDGHGSVVSYDQFKDDPRLTEYLDTLSRVSGGEFQTWPHDRQLAFLLNAYNAFTVALVTSRYPVESIKDIGGWSSPWSYDFIPLFGRKVSLDHIEHELIRGEGDHPGYGDHRIHFAVNCASIGCPALRPEAYTFDQLEQQLQDAERRFLTDRSRNRFMPSERALRVSPIFDWYSEDFVDRFGSLERYFTSRLHLLTTPAESEILSEQPLSIRFSTYDWRLNESR